MTVPLPIRNLMYPVLVLRISTDEYETLTSPNLPCGVGITTVLVCFGPLKRLEKLEKLRSKELERLEKKRFENLWLLSVSPTKHTKTTSIAKFALTFSPFILRV